MISSSISTSCAGGGKTTQIIHSIRKLLRKGYKVDRILILSFSNASVSNFKDRTNVTAYTLHSFILEYINFNYSIVTELKPIILSCLKKYPHLNKISIFNIEKMVKKSMTTWPVKKSFYESLSIGVQKIHDELFQLREEVRKNLEDMKSIAIEDICWRFYQNIYKFLPEIENNYDYIFIDEAQDFSILQLKIIEKIIKDIFCVFPKNFMIVGDPKQIIYQFQGANQQYYLAFLKRIIEIANKRSHILKVTEHRHTYRFGKNIANYLSDCKFLSHSTNNRIDRVISKKISISELFKIIRKYSYKKQHDNTTAVIFSHHCSLIRRIQNYCMKGIYTKIYLQQEHIYFVLQQVYSYHSTIGNSYEVSMKKLKEYGIDYRMLELNVCDQLKYIFKVINKNCSYVQTRLQEYLIEKSQYSINFTCFFLELNPIILLQEESDIIFSTIHGVKGKEFDTVIYIDIPFSRKVQELQSICCFLFNSNHRLHNVIQDEQESIRRNMLYTACTRAKTNLLHLKIVQ